MSFKNVMWGSKEFNNRVIAAVPDPEGPPNKNYVVPRYKYELISVKDSDPAMIKRMLSSGSYRFATEKEVKHWEFRKECELYR